MLSGIGDSCVCMCCICVVYVLCICVYVCTDVGRGQGDSTMKLIGECLEGNLEIMETIQLI